MPNGSKLPTAADLQQSLADGLDKLKDVFYSVGDHTLDLENKLKVPFPFNYLLAGGASLVGVVIYMVLSVGLAILLPVAVPLVTLMMGALMQVRQDTIPAQAELSAAALSEFLGTEIDPSHMATGKGANNAVAVASALGDALYNRLYQEFGLASGGTVGPGEKAARTFSGFAVNFATQNAMISTLADAISFHELEQFRELGVETARNLGLGRLQRLALGTLLQQVIQKPFQRELAYKVRPDRLSTVEYIHAHNRGDITADQLHQNLAEAGFRDEDIPAVINEYSGRLSVGELLTLIRHGVIDQTIATEQLMSEGIDKITAQWRLQAAELAIIDDNVKTYVDSLDTLVKLNRMDLPTWDAAMVEVPWTDDEKAWQRKALYANLQHPDRMLTWSQVITAFEQGIVDVDYVENWLTVKGYGPDDILNMELLLAVKYDAFVTAAQKKGATVPAKKPAPPA